MPYCSMQERLYQNTTDRMVIVKCIGENNFYKEKVVLPSEHFWFEAPDNSRLEIWTMSSNSHLMHLRADVSEYTLSYSDETALAS